MFLRTETDKHYLYQLLNTIANQTLKDFEIVMSIDSKSPLEFKLTELPFSLSNRCTIRYLPSTHTGISNNTNFSINMAHGKYIKIMFQDDLLAHNEVLDEIAQTLDASRRVWLVSASDHFDEMKQ